MKCSSIQQGLKTNGIWNEIHQMCDTKNAPPSETVGFKMTDLRGDTYYRIQIRAHNAIGFSKPVVLFMRTAVGESPNALGSLLYYGHSSASSIYNYDFIKRSNNMLFMLLFSFCLQFGFYVQ